MLERWIDYSLQGNPTRPEWQASRAALGRIAGSWPLTAVSHNPMYLAHYRCHAIDTSLHVLRVNQTPVYERVAQLDLNVCLLSRLCRTCYMTSPLVIDVIQQLARVVKLNSMLLFWCSVFRPPPFTRRPLTRRLRIRQQNKTTVKHSHRKGQRKC